MVMIKSKSLTNVGMSDEENNPILMDILKQRDDLLQENEGLKRESELHEAKVTELHSIIAELRRKLEESEVSRILEENEEEAEDFTDGEEYFEDGIFSEESTGICKDGTGTQYEKHSTSPPNYPKLLQSIHHIQEQHSQIKETLKEKDSKLAKALKSVETLEKEKGDLKKRVHHLNSLLNSNSPSHHRSPQNLCKFAQRVKLKQNKNQTPLSIRGQNLIQIAKTFNLDSSVVEKLVNLNEVAELSEVSLQSKEELLLFLEKANMKSAKLQNEVDFLLGRLADAKSQNEELVGVIGQVESWGMGWKVVAQRGESTVELYDILVALLESELGLLLANVRAAGFGNNGGHELDENELRHLLKRAEVNRETALSAARKVVGHGDGKLPSANHLESSIRKMIISLKTTTANLTRTIPEYDFNFNLSKDETSVGKGPSINTRKLDLETAVLMQELLACREEKADLKLRLVSVERERDFCLMLVNTTNICTSSNGNGSGANSANSPESPTTPSQSPCNDNEASRICNGQQDSKELNNNVEHATTLFDLDLDPTSNNLNPSPTVTAALLHQYNSLRECNKNLLTSLEECKEKYRRRVKLLEDRMVCMGGSE